jgi:hypothetical protein
MQHRPGLTRVLGASLAAWIAICGFAASHATADANDTSAGASGPLLHGVFWAGSIGTENDLDWYVLYSGASTELGVHLNGQGPDDCFGQVMELTDGDGRFLAGHGGSIDRSETGHILYTVDIGTYYVKVRPNNVAPCIGPDAKYTLWVTASPQLLTAPPPLPPAPPPSIAAPAPTTHTTGVRPGAVRGGTKPSFACRRARTWVRRLQRRRQRARRLRPAARRRQLASLRYPLRRAHSHVRRRC